jgi:hypothetical protein
MRSVIPASFSRAVSRGLSIRQYVEIPGIKEALVWDAIKRYGNRQHQTSQKFCRNLYIITVLIRAAATRERYKVPVTSSRNYPYPPL